MPTHKFKLKRCGDGIESRKVLNRAFVFTLKGTLDEMFETEKPLMFRLEELSTRMSFTFVVCKNGWRRDAHLSFRLLICAVVRRRRRQELPSTNVGEQNRGS